MWKKGYSIFAFTFGSVYNANFAMDKVKNFFDTETEGWEVLGSLTNLSQNVSYTVLPVMTFTSKTD